MNKVGQISSKELENSIIDVLEKKINPELLKHQGWVELERIVDNDVYIRFRGACSSCMSTYDTLDKTVKPELMKEVKEIKDVIIADEVSDELIELARSLFTRKSIK